MPQFFSNGATIIIAVLLVLAIAYRYYSAFLAAKVLALDPARITPAHTHNDGQNFYPTNKWILFGHHFAAISGAGPLIGPVLAAQFGYLPGLLWILVGVCLAGAVQDFVILTLSIRRNGRSLAQIAFSDIGPAAGAAATIGILFVLVIAIAGLGKVVTKALGGETISYPVGTEFIGSDTSNIMTDRTCDKTIVYRIPVGATIRFNGGSVPVTSVFRIESTPPPDIHVASDIDDSPKYLNEHPPAPPAVPPAATSPTATRTAPPVFRSGPRFAGAKGFHLTVPEGFKVTASFDGSTWGVFTIALTIPIAVFIGLYLHRFRKNRVLEASILGGVLTLAAVYLGGLVANPESSLNLFADSFNLTEHQVGYSIAIYGFIASILPVWMLLCPRDYLSSFLKIGTILLLIVGVILAHPHLQAPAINTKFLGGGPVVPGPIFPFLFITIMCGAISGFHSLVASGTTPKMINKESDARMIGYGAMLMEGLVGIVALIAAAALPVTHYYNINTPTKDLPVYQKAIEEVAQHDPAAKLDEPLPDVGEHIQGRTGGAVTLAVGMAHVLDTAARNLIGDPTAKTTAWLHDLYKYWYHFAIMFEALFILTTIDTGTRVGRFLLQETMGKWISPRLGQTNSWPSALIATAAISLGWWYFLDANAFAAIWQMFGIANQTLAVMALAIASAALVHSGKSRYVWVTLLPMCFVIITTGSASIAKISDFVHAFSKTNIANPLISLVCLIAINFCTLIVLLDALIASRTPRTPSDEIPVAQPPSTVVAQPPPAVNQ